MPARLSNDGRRDRLVRARGFERFLCPSQVELQEAVRVLRHLVKDLWSGDAVRVLEDRIENDAVLLVGKVFGNDAPHRGVAEASPETLVEALPPDGIISPGVTAGHGDRPA